MNPVPAKQEAHSALSEAPPAQDPVPPSELHPLELPVRQTPYDFAAIFGNKHPVELEVGIGKGRFLMLSAESRADTNFVGIEWANEYHKMAMTRALNKKLANIRFLRDDAAHTFRFAIAPSSLAGVHVYFPDPWPKKKHNKRRIIQPAFLDLVAQAVVRGGFLKLATDHEDYFAQMDEVTRSHPRFEVVERLIGEAAHVGVTNYEVKYRKEGRTIHNISCVVK